MMTTPMRPGAALLLCFVALVLTGCSSYAVRGVVIRGETSYVELVGKNDPRLEAGQPVSGATIAGIIDPQSLKSTRLKPVATDALGAFKIPVDNFGAGWLEYELGLIVRSSNFTPAEGHVDLPGGGRRVLVVLAPGTDRLGSGSAFDNDYSPERDFERFSH